MNSDLNLPFDGVFKLAAKATALALPHSDGLGLAIHQRLILMHLSNIERYKRASAIYDKSGCLKSAHWSLKNLEEETYTAAGLTKEKRPKLSSDRRTEKPDYRRQVRAAKKDGSWFDYRLKVNRVKAFAASPAFPFRPALGFSGNAAQRQQRRRRDQATAHGYKMEEKNDIEKMEAEMSITCENEMEGLNCEEGNEIKDEDGEEDTEMQGGMQTFGSTMNPETGR